MKYKGFPKKERFHQETKVESHEVQRSFQEIEVWLWCRKVLSRGRGFGWNRFCQEAKV